MGVIISFICSYKPGDVEHTLQLYAVRSYDGTDDRFWVCTLVTPRTLVTAVLGTDMYCRRWWRAAHFTTCPSQSPEIQALLLKEQHCPRQAVPCALSTRSG